jgi:hypothetical protein
MGGHITVNSEEGIGSTFTFEIDLQDIKDHNNNDSLLSDDESTYAMISISNT